MKLSHALTTLLLLIGSSTYAGSYTFQGHVVDNHIATNTIGPDEDFIPTPVPAPDSMAVRLDYSSAGINYGISVGDLTVTTSGFTTTYSGSPWAPLGTINILGPAPSYYVWPDFGGWFVVPTTMLTVTAPPPGQGPDSITMYGYLPLGHDTGGDSSTVQIFAPNGTLTNSTDLPATLNSFTGGSWQLTVGDFIRSGGPDGGLLAYTGLADGTLNVTPEPTTIVLMLI
jgi:hypothetical protein